MQPQICHSQIFQSTPSLRKVTIWRLVFIQLLTNFNPHLPYGRWPLLFLKGNFCVIFQSTPSLRKVTGIARWHFGKPYYFNPHLPYGRWPRTLLYNTVRNKISIHTFLTEGDTEEPADTALYKISIHTFLTEGDGKYVKIVPKTPNFNPHLPYGRWRFYVRTSRHFFRISIHTFLTEGDFSLCSEIDFSSDFNPHLPYGRWRQRAIPGT